MAYQLGTGLVPVRKLGKLPADTLSAPIRWGTELYQSGEGIRPGASFIRGAGGSSVASELQRIRGFSDRVKDQGAVPPAASPEPAEPAEPTDAGAIPVGSRVRSPRFGLNPQEPDLEQLRVVGHDVAEDRVDAQTPPGGCVALV